MIDVHNIKKIVDNKIKTLTKNGKILKKNFEDSRKKRKKKFIDGVLEELEANHNHSWYDELLMRNKNNLNDVALFYRGTEVTYGEMFEKMLEYAKSLKSLGVSNNDEIAVCMSNSPEFVYLLGAASIVGAKINSFAPDFDKDYVSEIINGCNSKVMFVEDNFYPEIMDAINSSSKNKVIISSLANSLDFRYDKYKKYDERHNSLFIDKTSAILSQNSRCLSIPEFLSLGNSYKGQVKENTNLDHEFTITYSSGTTSNRPKAIVHTMRSFITIGRCHDTDVQKTASMKNFTIQSNAPTFSNTDLISNISDSLMQGARLALEPIYDGTGEFFIDSLLINDPTYVIATRSIWLKTIKKIMFDEKYKNAKFKKLLIPFAVGEGLEPGEEKFINMGLRKAKAGTGVLNVPFSPVTISLAGGDCEHGGIFWLLYHSLVSKGLGYLRRGEQSGMKAFEMVDYAILDRNGNYCKPYEYGRLVANSPCNMKCYKDNKDATNNFFIKDATGKVWGDCSVYSYLDFKGRVHMKGRIPKDEKEIPPFKLTDVICLDTKNILSCETVPFDDVFVAHIELQPDCRSDILTIINSADMRCKKLLGNDLASKIVYRIHSNKEGFVTTHSGKRDIQYLADEGISKAIKPIVVDGILTYIEASSNMKDKEKNKTYIKG